MEVTSPMFHFGAFALALLILVGCGPFAFGEPNLDPPVDQPARIVFLLRLGEPITSMPMDDRPQLFLQLSEDDAAILGTAREHAFEWNANGSTNMQASISAENFWQESEEQRIDWPCMQDSITVGSPMSDEVVTVLQAGYCPVPGSPAIDRIDGDLVRPLLPNG